MNIDIIIQARLGSRRFPGKVLAKLAGKPVIAHVIERCIASGLRVIVAVPYESGSGALVDWVRLNSTCVLHVETEAAENDVLKRVRNAMVANGTDVAIRVCADCPLISPENIFDLADVVRQDRAGAFGYFGYRLFWRGREFPAIRLKHGLPEAIRLETVKALLQYRDDLGEHVTWGCYFPLQIETRWIPYVAPVETNLCVDVPRDIERLELLMQHSDR